MTYTVLFSFSMIEKCLFKIPVLFYWYLLFFLFHCFQYNMLFLCFLNNIWFDFLTCECMLNHFSHVQLFVTPRTITWKAPLYMGLSRWEYCSGLPFPSPGELPHAGLNPSLPHWRQILYYLSPQGSPIYQFQLYRLWGCFYCLIF